MKGDSNGFVSGPWMGFYTYSSRPGRHRMDLVLEFGNGRITGEGTDDLGPFIIAGRIDGPGGQCHWTKTYVGAHDVFYRGRHDGKAISGTWEIGQSLHGGFRIWLVGSVAGDEDREAEQKDEPVEAVGTIGAGGRVFLNASALEDKRRYTNSRSV